MSDEIRSGLLDDVQDLDPRSMAGSGVGGGSTPGTRTDTDQDASDTADADGTDGADADGSDASDADGSDSDSDASDSDSDGSDASDADGTDRS